jgi:hypothetical protein
MSLLDLQKADQLGPNDIGQPRTQVIDTVPALKVWGAYSGQSGIPRSRLHQSRADPTGIIPSAAGGRQSSACTALGTKFPVDGKGKSLND